MPSIKRRRDLPSYHHYSRYKPYLRIDFCHRCCYCGVCESDLGGSRRFAVDHFRPKSWPEFAELVTSYSNLYYACDTCNTYKSDVWPSPAEQAQGFRFWDACQDLSKDHFVFRRNSGEAVPLTVCAKYTDRIVRINREVVRKMRIQRLERIELYRKALRITREYEAQLPTILEPLKRQMVEAGIQFNRRVIEEMRPRLIRAMDS